jgi:hypothetical protein
VSTTSRSGDDPDPYGDWYEQDPYGEGPVEDEPEPDEDEDFATSSTKESH